MFYIRIKASLLASIIFMLLSACAGKESLTSGKIFAEPDYELSALRFIDVDMERLNLEIDLKITNPNYLPLEFQDVNYQLNMDGARVLSGVLVENLKVPAKGDVIMTVPLTVSLDRLSNGALNLMMNRRVQYEMSAKFNSTIPILEIKTFTVKKADELSF